MYKGQRIYSTTRVRNVNESKEGGIEWVYGDEDLFYDAFYEAREKFGGELKQHYLEGIDPNIGKVVESINELAEERMKQLPNYTG